MKIFRRCGGWTSLLGAAVVLLGSCAKSNHKPVYPVHGQVFYNGKPATGALILFHEINAPASQEARPHGQVDQNGDFVLSTYAAKDGAPAGDYVVTVDWRQAIPGRGAAGPSILPPEYGMPQRSPLRSTVRAENNNLPPFHLER